MNAAPRSLSATEPRGFPSIRYVEIHVFKHAIATPLTRVTAFCAVTDRLIRMRILSSLEVPDLIRLDHLEQELPDVQAGHTRGRLQLFRRHGFIRILERLEDFLSFIRLPDLARLAKRLPEAGLAIELDCGLDLLNVPSAPVERRAVGVSAEDQDRVCAAG